MPVLTRAVLTHAVLTHAVLTHAVLTPLSQPLMTRLSADRRRAQ